MAKKQYGSILIISDLHAPYMHPDAVEFLAAVAKKYKPELIINIGDEIDGHSWSYHETNVSLPNPDEEINMAIHALKPIYKMFPMVHVLNSNHGSLAVRKGQTSSLPNRYIRSNKEALEAPTGWHWYDYLDVEMTNGNMVRFVHHLGVNVFNAAKDIGMSLVAGHVHTKLGVDIRYLQGMNKTIFGMHVGCLIDNKKLAFAYNKTTAKEPAIGCGVIVDGVPIPIAMIRDKNNRWVGRKKK